MKRLNILILLTFPTWGVMAFAQTATPVPSPDLPQGTLSSGSSSAQWLVDLAQNHPWLMTVIFVMGALRLTLKPVFTLLHQVLPQWGLASWDQEIIAVEKSKAVTWLYWLLDYVGSVKVPVKSTSPNA